MGIEDKEYMKERARERQRAEDQKKTFKGEFNDNKYNGREWSVNSSQTTSSLPDNPWLELKRWGTNVVNFLKHRSGKGVPLSVLELFQYLCYIIFVIWVIDRPNLPMEWRIIPITMMSALSIYVLRQYKIRTYDDR